MALKLRDKNQKLEKIKFPKIRAQPDPVAAPSNNIPEEETNSWQGVNRKRRRKNRTEKSEKNEASDDEESDKNRLYYR